MSHIPQDVARRLADKLDAAPYAVLILDAVGMKMYPPHGGPDSDLYSRLESLSKALEGKGRIDEHDHPDAYGTVLDGMRFVAGAAPSAPAPAEVPMPEPYATLHHDDGHFTTKTRDDGKRTRPFRTDVVTLEQCAAYAAAREAAERERVREALHEEIDQVREDLNEEIAELQAIIDQTRADAQTQDAALERVRGALRNLIEHFDAYRGGWIGQDVWRDRFGLQDDLAAARALGGKA
jgi:DNA-binding transcriptional MerR regulator